MDLDNQCKAALRSELKKALLLHGDYRAWHYALDLPDNNDPSSLSAYLKLTKEQYEDLLVISGLALTRQCANGDTKLHIQSKECKGFLVSIGMDPEDKGKERKNYFNKTKVTSIKKHNVTGFFLVM